MPATLPHAYGLYGGYGLGSAKRARTAAEKEGAAAYLTPMRVGWGQENSAFRQLFTSLFIHVESSGRGLYHARRRLSHDQGVEEGV